MIVWRNILLTTLTTASGIVLSFGVAKLAKSPKIISNIVGASAGAFIGIMYAVKNRPLLLK